MPPLLILKLFLVPTLIALITMAGRRWGAAVAGALAAFPVVTGPILFFIAIEQGEKFAALASAAAILAVLGNIGFGIAYSWASRRHSWFVSLLSGWIVYFCLTGLFNLLRMTPLQAGILTLCGLLIAAKSYPEHGADLPNTQHPRSDLLYRMLAAAALVFAVTLFSAQLGPNLTGLFAVFPVMASVLAVFSHRHYGAGYAIRMLQGMVRGFYGFAVFCLILAYTLGTLSLAYCFAFGLFAASLIQVIMMRRHVMCTFSLTDEMRKK